MFRDAKALPALVRQIKEDSGTARHTVVLEDALISLYNTCRQCNADDGDIGPDLEDELLNDAVECIDNVDEHHQKNFVA